MYCSKARNNVSVTYFLTFLSSIFLSSWLSHVYFLFFILSSLVYILCNPHTSNVLGR